MGWSEVASRGRDQKRVFIKSMLFIGAFLVAWIPCIIGGALDLQIVLCIFAPLQGVLNVLIYSNLLNVFKEEAKERTASIRRSMSMTGSSSLNYANRNSSKNQFSRSMSMSMSGSISTDTDFETRKSSVGQVSPSSSDLDDDREETADEDV